MIETLIEDISKEIDKYDNNGSIKRIIYNLIYQIISPFKTIITTMTIMFILFIIMQIIILWQIIKLKGSVVLHI